MVDGGWNSEKPVVKKGLPAWAKVLIGCGVFFFLALLLVVGSCIGVFRYAARNPEQFEKKISGAIGGFAQEDWTRFRNAVTSLATDEGASRLYADSPGLKAKYPAEADFLAEVAKWRPRLEPLPEQVPLLSSGRLVFNIHNGGRSIGYGGEKGHFIQVDFDEQGVSGITVRPVNEGDRAPGI